MQRKISILKCPRIWRIKENEEKLPTIFSQGDVKSAMKWGHLYSTDCNICKKKNECKGICKH